MVTGKIHLGKITFPVYQNKNKHENQNQNKRRKPEQNPEFKQKTESQQCL